MIKNIVSILSIFLLFACSAMVELPADAAPTAKQNELESSSRIVAVGDIHGDYEQFLKVLKAANLIDRKNRWIGGSAHLVQLGDIPDRGPDSRKAMDLLMKLEKSAAKKGGSVTVLIGNHDAMMMINDLRYVHPGEYAAFKDKKSKARRNAYYQQTVAHIKNTTPEEQWPIFDKSHKKEWEAKFPLGYVEHRMAWAPTGKYGKWTLSRAAVAKIGDSLFVHGGISENYAAMGISEINTRVRTDLADSSKLTQESIVEDSNGPLWYRGWIRSLENDENEARLDAILAAYGVQRMVVAHEPLIPAVLPRFGGKILGVDVGISAHYGNGLSALEIVDGEARTILENESLPLPANAQAQQEYFAKLAKLLPDTQKVDRYLAAQAKAAAEHAAQAQSEGAKQAAEN